jgi:hypothetical protein
MADFETTTLAHDRGERTLQRVRIMRLNKALALFQAARSA